MFALGQIARGLLVHQFTTRRANCLLLSEELNRASILRRMTKLWSREEAAEIEDGFRVRYDSNLDFYSRTLESQKRLERIWKDQDKPDILAIDALSYIHHGNENSNQDMGLVFGSIKDVAKNCGFHAPIIHHTGKNPGDFKKGRTRFVARV